MKVCKINSKANSVAVFLLLCFAANPALSVELKDFFKRADQRAVELLEQGRNEEAATLFEDEQWRGVSQYRAGKFAEAMEEFQGLEDARALFNHGTAAAKAGDYPAAVESLAAAVNLEPDNQEFEHNLDIAKKLKELAESNQSEQPQEGENSDEQSDEQEQQEGSESEKSEDSQGQLGESSEESEDGNESSQNGGELSADAGESQTEDPLEPEDMQDTAEDQSEVGQQAEEQQAEGEESEAAAVAETSVSEDDQATEQWLRRIPDDASHLLRNKIRLNHMIEYPNVDNMQEPW